MGWIEIYESGEGGVVEEDALDAQAGADAGEVTRYDSALSSTPPSPWLACVLGGRGRGVVVLVGASVRGGNLLVHRLFRDLSPD